MAYWSWLHSIINPSRSSGRPWCVNEYMDVYVRWLLCGCNCVLISVVSLRWRRNGHDGVSNHQPHHCLLNRLFGCYQRKHQSSASLAFVREIHRGPVNSPHKWPVTRKMFPFDDVIMCYFVILAIALNGTRPNRTGQCVCFMSLYSIFVVDYIMKLVTCMMCSWYWLYIGELISGGEKQECVQRNYS